MKLYQVIIRRIFLLIPVLIGATIITFSLSHIFRDPILSYISQARIEFVTEATLDALRKQHGLDKPWFEQYLYYLWDLLRGDWGISQSSGSRPVLENLAKRFPATLELTLVAITVAVFIGIPLGIVSAVNKDTKIDHAARLMALSGVSVPVFWLALILKFLLASSSGIKLFPLIGRVQYNVNSANPLAKNILDITLPVLGRVVIPRTDLFIIDSLLTFNIPFLLSALHSIFLPAVALSWITIALISRLTRTSMLESLKQDYVVLARSKGLSERVVIYKHALRNAMIPTVTIIGLSFAALLTGAVLTETVFSWPGLGSFVVDAIVQQDSASVQGFVILAGFIYVLLNLAVDILYTIVDPRITL